MLSGAVRKISKLLEKLQVQIGDLLVECDKMQALEAIMFYQTVKSCRTEEESQLLMYTRPYWVFFSYVSVELT